MVDPVRYISTRGHGPARTFEEVLLTGLAPDGGLYVPELLPQVSGQQLNAWESLGYSRLALEIARLFMADEVPEAALGSIMEQSYQGFDHPEVAPLRQLAPNEYLLELFHGPTLAFKDFALQVMGRLLDYVLRKNCQRVVILGATSGDTGSAALEGCRHSEQVDIVILHPHQRVSEVQRKQMTTVPGDNVLNLAIQGNFDDCQRLVKAAFADQTFLPPGRQLVAVNSINWARILMQIVYYFFAALKLGAPQYPVSFAVPTGNFGDIYAGYLALGMGLPVDRLIVATNKNDILHRFISRNDYSITGVIQTHSPSMDILVSSNFERYLFDLFERDASRLTAFMQQFGKQKLQVSEAQWRQAQSVFDSASVDDDTTCRLMAEVYRNHGLVLDPHTAVGLQSARVCRHQSQAPIVTLATAHPSKFGEAVSAAGLTVPELPASVQHRLQQQERYQVIPAELSALTASILQHF